MLWPALNLDFGLWATDLSHALPVDERPAPPSLSRDS
jgi:hypothetical protein